MSDYISRKAFVESQRHLYCDKCAKRKGMKRGKMQFVYDIGDAPCRACDIADVLDAVEDFPAADVREVVRGTWMPRDLTWVRSYYYCSACEETVDMPTAMGVPMFRYCPNCGADMKSPKEGE